MAGRIRVLEMIDEAGAGGGQIHVLSLAQHLDPDIFDVLVACEGSGFLVDEMRKLGKAVIPVSMNNRPSIRTMRDVLSTLRGARCDILHTHGGTPGFWGRVGAALAGLPVKRVHTYHGFHYLHDASVRSGLLQRIDRWLLRYTDNVICVCESDFETGIAHGLVDKAKSVVIHNGIEVKRFRHNGDRESVRRGLGVGPADFLFGTIGRLHRQKGQQHLLEAFRDVFGRHPNARLVLVGEGELLHTLRRQAIALGIDPAVSFAGQRDDIPGLLAAMDVFVLSSLWEGQPISLLEAMAAGRAVVSTDVDGIGDILENMRNALLVPAGSAQELAQAMNTMMESDVMRRDLAGAAEATVSGSYTVEAMAHKTGALYRNLISK